MDLKEEAILGDAVSEHWYYRAKAAAMLACLDGAAPRRILDVGAGSAFFSKELLSRSDALEAVCVDTSYDGERTELYQGKRMTFCRAIRASDADVVLLMDVLEHVDDDLGLLLYYKGLVPPGARFLITVPAFAFLWSGHDVFLEHRRRYSRNDLVALVTRAGLRIECCYYFFGLLFPVALATRLFSPARLRSASQPRSQLKRHHPFVNSVLHRICRHELPFAQHNRLAGLSVFCFAYAPGGDSP